MRQKHIFMYQYVVSASGAGGLAVCCLRYGDLLDAEGCLAVVALLEVPLWPRFDDRLILDRDGALDRLPTGVHQASYL